MTEPASRRPVRPEWEAFAQALTELLAARGLNKLELANIIDADRRLAGAVVSGREPCPEWFLMRLHREHERLGGEDHIRILVERWTEATGASPAFLAPAPGAQPPAAVGETQEDEPHRWRPRRTAVVGVLLVGVAIVAAVFARTVLPDDDSDAGTTVTHLFPADYAGEVHVIVQPEGTPAPTRVLLDWGPWHREVRLRPRSEATALVFAKVDLASTVPLRVRVTPSAHVQVGVGRVPSALDVNEGWSYQG